MRLSSALVRAALPYLRRRGLAEESLLAHWEDVMGSVLAERVSPERMVRPRDGGLSTLHLVVSSGGVALEVQHLSPQIIERINGFLGRQAVGRLVLRQGPVLRRNTPRRCPPEPDLSRDEKQRLDAVLADVLDSDMRAALLRLGEAVARRRTTSRSSP